MQTRFLVGCLITLFFAAACAPPSVQEEPDLAEVTQAVSEMLERYDAAMNSGELEYLSSHYTADAVGMPNGSPVLVGIEAIRAWAESMRDQFEFELHDTLDEVTVVGDWAFLRGSYTITQTPRDGGEPTTGVGKWMAVDRRQPDGTWKTHWDMFNSDEPES